MPAAVCQIAKKTHVRVLALLSQRLGYLHDYRRIENAELREPPCRLKNAFMCQPEAGLPASHGLNRAQA